MATQFVYVCLPWACARALWSLWPVTELSCGSEHQSKHHTEPPSMLRIQLHSPVDHTHTCQKLWHKTRSVKKRNRSRAGMKTHFLSPSYMFRFISLGTLFPLSHQAVSVDYLYVLHHVSELNKKLFGLSGSIRQDVQCLGELSLE